ncbi:hypothetical protein CLOM_g21115 [Closterium sp. NIES-68]|nr:hypothetical protein CLOM_g21115 [Closterium sp. NIES-68]
MEQPEGYNDGSGRVWKLKKALYGLKQDPRQWYIKLREVLEAIGFTPSTADQSLFMLGEGEQRSFMVKWHWVRSMVTAGEVELHYVKTTAQPADMMTKRLVEQQHWKCCKLAGMALN